MNLANKLKQGLASADTFQLRPELLLLPNIPKPMHGLAPRVVLGKEWWDRERTEAAVKTGNRCAACGASRWSLKPQMLEGHEVYAIDYCKGTMTYVECVPLCHFCHMFIHSGLLEVLESQGQITLAQRKMILQHGQRILRRANLRKKQPYSGPCASWSKWRLVIGTKKYKPLTRNYDEWFQRYAVGKRR